MMVPNYFQLMVAVGGVLGVITTYPYVGTAIAYRRRDNGLAYLVFVMGVGIWNGMLAAQLLSTEPLVKVFFLSLGFVGSLLAGLGWFLFATTASTTPLVSNRRLVYGVCSGLVGLDITLAVTAPAHTFFWTSKVETPAYGFATITPLIGYWLHTELLLLLFAGGTLLFASAWQTESDVRYPRAYTIAGVGTIIAITASNVLAPGGLSVAPLVAVSLTSVGWLQAQRGGVFRLVETWRSSLGL